MEYALIVSVISACIGLIAGIIYKVFREGYQVVTLLKKLRIYLVIFASMIVTFVIFISVTNDQIGPWSNNNAYKETGTDKKIETDNSSLENNNFIPGPLLEEDIILVNIQLYSDITEAKKTINKEPKKEGGLYGTLYLFDNDVQVTVSRSTNKISGVYMLSDKYKTTRGASIGNSAEFIRKLYGEPDDQLQQEDIPDEPHSYALEYYYRGGYNAILRFSIDKKSNIVQYIGVRAYNGKL